MSLDHLRAIREYELQIVLPHLNQKQLILEIGSGNGWQAQCMTARGLKVITLDLPEIPNRHDTQKICFDGIHFPLQNASVDVVYTSNVLEHISQLQSFHKEIRRVLKPHGTAIHVLPTATWRWWTSCGFYLSKFHALPGKFRFQNSTTAASPPLPDFRHRIIPERHGSHGNSFTELHSFRCNNWIESFLSSGWNVESTQANRLFYTGYSLLDNRLSLTLRHYLSYFMGSSCVIYVLR